MSSLKGVQRKRRGPRVEPWSIPAFRYQSEEKEQAKEAEKVQPVK